MSAPKNKGQVTNDVIAGMQKTFSASLRALRKQYGWSQGELADRLNVKANSISNWECLVAYPDFTTLLGLCLVLKTSPDAMVGLTDKSRLTAVESDNAHLQKELRDLQEKLVAQGKDLDAAQAELEGYKERNSAMATELRSLHKDLTELADANNAVKALAGTGIGTVADRVADKLGDRVEALEKELAQQRQETAQAKASAAEYLHRIQLAQLAIKLA
jgi:transcriptional regulator with XRE-family HTH domain